MMMRKACPRCRGDLFLDRNEGPATLTCLQCGRSFAPAALAPEQGRALVAAVAAARDRAA
jgi:ribosomal protein L37AE/L43A